MRGFFISAAALGCICLSANAQEAIHFEELKVEKLDSAVVSVSRAGRNTPVTYSTVNREELRSSSPINSLPMTLSLQPSVVTTNEGGTGLGYSKMTVRGSKGSQINVTLNGITLNDSESQEVFWVNIPSLSNILGNVQLQRGLGTSSNGAGAFGASINMSTSFVNTEPSASIEASAGSFGTFATTVTASSGKLKNGFYANLAYNYSTTDGYIRNAWADVNSIFGVVGWMNAVNSLKFTYLRGSQHTGITWEGIPASVMESDRRYNPAGEYCDSEGNVKYYDNESDNYIQSHYQFNYTHQFEAPLVWSTTLNYTKGDGYYEQYKAGKSFSKYGMTAPAGISEADFITRKEMDNGYLVLNSTLKYKSRELDLSGGIYLSKYTGNHFGDVLWCSALGKAYDYSDEWYRNKSIKKEATAFVRAEWQASPWLTTYAELQGRYISLTMSGIDDEFSDLDYSTPWAFFNPRVGATARWGAHKAYASVALGHREPGRSDLKEQIESVNTLRAAGNEAEVSLKPEKMLDTEIGYEFASTCFTAGVNLYSMEYKDMLLETGKISNSGYAIKENVDRSWRRGVELSAAWKALEWLSFNGNLTLSDNKIKDYVYFVDTYDNSTDWTPMAQTRVEAGTVNMLMSPSTVGMLGAEVKPGYGFKLAVNGKYVGKQYWDNTQNAARCIPSYFVMNANAEKVFKFKVGKLTLGAYVNNLLNREYYADAWVYRAMFANGDPDYQEEGLFPQAPINFSFKARFEF